MGCFKIMGQVLDVNQRAFDLYMRLGGEYMKEWRTIDVNKENVLKLALS